jgi:hypothetical protein
MSGPSNKWEKLDPRVPVQRAEDFLHLVGGGWAAVQGRVEKADPTFHQPLFDPAMLPTPGPPQEPPPRPSEQMLRDTLRTALAAEQEAKTALDNATQAYQRAQALVQQRNAEVETFAGLDAEITDYMVEALKGGDGRADLTPELQEKQTARDRAVAAVAHAEHAKQVLEDDLAQARDKARVRQQITYGAMLPLLAQAAEQITQEIRDYEAAITKLQSRLMGFDMASAGHPAAMPGDVRDYIFTKMYRRIATPSEVKPWHDACEQLRADPDRVIEIADPEPPPPKENLVIVPPWLQALRARDAQVLAEREAEAAQAQAAQEPPAEPSPPEAA